MRSSVAVCEHRVLSPRSLDRSGVDCRYARDEECIHYGVCRHELDDTNTVGDDKRVREEAARSDFA